MSRTQRQVYVTQEHFVPMSWTSFKVNRELYENKDKLGFYYMAGETRGKIYQIIYNSHEEDSTERKDRIIVGLTAFPEDSNVEITGSWHVFIRGIGASITTNITVLVKDFRKSTAKSVQGNYGVPRASVYVRPQDDALALLGALEAENELRKAKLKLEGGEQRALDIIDKLIPSKRVADESSRPADESSRPVPGNRQHTPWKPEFKFEGGEQRAQDIFGKLVPSKRVADESSRPADESSRPVPGNRQHKPWRTDGHVNGEETSQSQNEAQDRQLMNMQALEKLADKKAGDTEDDAISLDGDNEDEEMRGEQDDQAVPQTQG